MMKVSFKIFVIAFICFGFANHSAFAQKSLSKLLKTHNKNNVPYITAETLASPKTNAMLLDSREPNEYKVSHLKDAICVGYDNFNLEAITNKVTDKSTPIVVYCSLGIRSEIVADKLIKAGYTNVKNLYGGIFEWKNKDFNIYNSQKQVTDSVHTFSKEWSKWLKKGTKVYPVRSKK